MNINAAQLTELVNWVQGLVFGIKLGDFLIEIGTHLSPMINKTNNPPFPYIPTRAVLTSIMGGNKVLIKFDWGF